MSPQTAMVVALALFGATIVFHGLVIAGVVPMDVVWGGRLSSREELLRWEPVSMLTLLLAAAVVVLRTRSIVAGNPLPIVAVATWAFAGIFALNTIGNLFAKTLTERVVFTPLTLATTLIFLRLGLERVGAGG